MIRVWRPSLFSHREPLWRDWVMTPERSGLWTMNRAYQFLLIATFIPFSWLALQAVHELGHVTAA